MKKLNSDKHLFNIYLLLYYIKIEKEVKIASTKKSLMNIYITYD